MTVSSVKSNKGLIYAAMEDIVTNCLKYRTVGKKSKRKNVSFSCEGANWVFSFDNHVKLMGPQKNIQL